MMISATTDSITSQRHRAAASPSKPAPKHQLQQLTPASAPPQPVIKAQQRQFTEVDEAKNQRPSYAHHEPTSKDFFTPPLRDNASYAQASLDSNSYSPATKEFLAVVNVVTSSIATALAQAYLQQGSVMLTLSKLQDKLLDTMDAMNQNVKDMSEQLVGELKQQELRIKEAVEAEHRRSGFFGILMGIIQIACAALAIAATGGMGAIVGGAALLLSGIGIVSGTTQLIAGSLIAADPSLYNNLQGYASFGIFGLAGENAALAAGIYNLASIFFIATAGIIKSIAAIAKQISAKLLLTLVNNVVMVAGIIGTIIYGAKNGTGDLGDILQSAIAGLIGLALTLIYLKSGLRDKVREGVGDTTEKIIRAGLMLIISLVSISTTSKFLKNSISANLSQDKKIKAIEEWTKQLQFLFERFSIQTTFNNMLMNFQRFSKSCANLTITEAHTDLTISQAKLDNVSNMREQLFSSGIQTSENIMNNLNQMATNSTGFQQALQRLMEQIELEIAGATLI